MPDRSRSKRQLRIGLAIALVLNTVLVVLNETVHSPATQFGIGAVTLAWAWSAVFIVARQRRERGPDA